MPKFAELCCWDEHTWTTWTPKYKTGSKRLEIFLQTQKADAILHQVQHGIIRFIGAYEQNYHSSVKSDNTTVEHWETMQVHEKVAPCVKRWLFNMRLEHMSGKLIPAVPLSRLTNLPSAVGSELQEPPTCCIRLN